MKSPGLFWLGHTMKLPFWSSFRSSSSACWPVAYAWNHLHGNDRKNDRHQQKGHDQGNPPSRILTFQWPSSLVRWSFSAYVRGWKVQCWVWRRRLLSNCKNMIIARLHVMATLQTKTIEWPYFLKVFGVRLTTSCKGCAGLQLSPNRVKVSTTRIMGIYPQSWVQYWQSIATI